MTEFPVPEGLLGCARCALSETRQRVVPGVGPLEARLVVVGEAPGASEDEGGEPFIGRSGRLLTRLIEEEIGLAREGYAITNAVKCRPPENRTPNAGEVATCRPWLEAQFDELKPRVILALGATAAKSLFSTSDPISVLRSRALQFRAVPGVVTYHPAAVLRGGATIEALMREDLARVRDLLEAP